MEEKTYEELVDMHKEITAKLEGLGEEDLEKQEQEIQEQIKELEKRLLDLCKRKVDKEAETKLLFEKLDTLNPMLAVMRRSMILQLQMDADEKILKLQKDGEEAEDRNKKNEDRKRKMDPDGDGDGDRDGDGDGDGDRDAATLEENPEDDEPANLVGQHTYISHA